MTRSFITAFTAALVWFSAPAQQANWWAFGENAIVDFSSGSPMVSASSFNMPEASACISNAAGPLFYTDGIKVYKPNGSVIPASVGGSYSMSGNLSTTQALIVPLPGSNSVYYVFTVNKEGTGKVMYSTVDLSAGAGGQVTSVNAVMPNPGGTVFECEKLTAVKACNGDYWVITHEYGSNKFKAFPITSGGVGTPVISAAGASYSGNPAKLSAR